MSDTVITDVIVVTDQDYDNFPRLTQKIEVTVDTLPKAKIERNSDTTDHTTIAVTDRDWDRARPLIQELSELVDELERLQHLEEMHKPEHAEFDHDKFPGRDG